VSDAAQCPRYDVKPEEVQVAPNRKRFWGVIDSSQPDSTLSFPPCVVACIVCYYTLFKKTWGVILEMLPQGFVGYSLSRSIYTVRAAQDIGNFLMKASEHF
jgi:hypothetical protein